MNPCAHAVCKTCPRSDGPPAFTPAEESRRPFTRVNLNSEGKDGATGGGKSGLPKATFSAARVFFPEGRCTGASEMAIELHLAQTAGRGREVRSSALKTKFSGLAPPSGMKGHVGVALPHHSHLPSCAPKARLRSRGLRPGDRQTRVGAGSCAARQREAGGGRSCPAQP